MLKIGDFSKLSRVSIRMLRHYDEIGLLKPSDVDPSTGYRYYSEKQLPTVGRITALKDMGFGLTAIGEILSAYEDKEILDRYFSLKEAELRELSMQAEQRLRLLETARERLRKDDTTMKYNVTLRTLPERSAATVRMTIPRYDCAGMLWSVLASETAHLKLIPDDPCYCSVVFHDSEYKEADVDLEAQKTIKGSYPDTEHVRFKTLPAVTFASATFQGSYNLLREVNAAVAQWVRDNGYTFDGPSFNIYHVRPHESPNPDGFVTEVCYPVKKK